MKFNGRLKKIKVLTWKREVGIINRRKKGSICILSKQFKEEEGKKNAALADAATTTSQTQKESNN